MRAVAPAFCSAATTDWEPALIRDAETYHLPTAKTACRFLLESSLCVGWHDGLACGKTPGSSPLLRNHFRIAGLVERNPNGESRQRGPLAIGSALFASRSATRMPKPLRPALRRVGRRPRYSAMGAWARLVVTWLILPVVICLSKGKASRQVKAGVKSLAR
jgi:hypothetical protein